MLKLPFQLYRNFGKNSYVGEKITQLQHATQCGLLAEKYVLSSEFKCLKERKNLNIPFLNENIIVGSFLHNIGQLLVFEDKIIPYMIKERGGKEDNLNICISNHEELGGDYLNKLGFPTLVSDIVRNHINTERYLISKDKNYYNNLSKTSKKSFEFQGGLFTSEELTNFERDSFFEIHLKMIEWNNKAKIDDPDFLETIENMNLIDKYEEMAQVFNKIKN